MQKLIVLLLLLPAFCGAQKNYSAQLDAYMQAQADFNNFNGAVLVAQKGKIIYQKAFGLANREWNIPNTIETRFLIGSLTKQFTAAAVLQLVDQEKLSLDDKLTAFFPGFPKGDSVTIHMLLNHTSGIKSYTSLPNRNFIMANAYPKDSVIAFFQNHPYDFSPGSKYLYNNSGYFLLGRIIEKTSGLSYADYVARNLMQKAGLKNTGVNSADTILPNRASGYAFTAGAWKAAPNWSPETAYSGGSLFSTVGDLYRWQQALFSGKIISATSLLKMTTPYLNEYGYGLGIDTFLQHKFIRHSGGFSSFNSYGAFFPDDDVWVFVLSNTDASSPAIAIGLAATVFNLPVALARKRQPVKINPDSFDKYTGRYLTWDGATMELLRRGNQFYRKQGQSEVELQPESATKFFYANGRDVQINFIENSNGDGVEAELIHHGVTTKLKRLN